MKLRFVGLAVLLGLSFDGLADPAHDRIATERAAANARLAEQERECETRFIVAPCLDSARQVQRAAATRLRRQELQLDDAKRREAAAERRKAIAEKTEARQVRAGDAKPESPRVRMRDGSQASPSPAPQAAEVATPLRPAGGVSHADRALTEQRNREKFDARMREEQARREAAERRNAQRAAQGKLAPPLPALPGASPPR